VIWTVRQYAPKEMAPLFRKAQQARTSAPVQEPKSSAPEPDARPSTAEQRAAGARAAAEEARAAKLEREDAARRAAEEKKEAARSAADEARRAAEEKKEAARVAAEEKKEAQRQAAEDARRAADEKKEAARAAAEEKKEAARVAAEEARKAAEEKKEALRKAAEEKKEAALKAAEDARIAAEEKKAEAARMAEEARVAEIDKRMKTPPPVGKLLEEPWKGQAIGYPVLVRVKLPPPPPKIEPERVEVVKVVTEFSGPGVPAPIRIELKPNKEGAYEGGLPCDVSRQEGEVTYYTTAYNKYDNVVASGGSINKPNQVQIKAEFASRLGHMPGELPPTSCEESERRAKAAGPNCGAGGCKDTAAATAPVCEGGDCGGGATNLPIVKPAGRGCLRCVVGAANPSMDWALTGVEASASSVVKAAGGRNQPPRGQLPII
jgi:chemotaxis protein histidine kinase CheA